MTPTTGRILRGGSMVSSRVRQNGAAASCHRPRDTFWGVAAQSEAVRSTVVAAVAVAAAVAVVVVVLDLNKA